MSSNPMSSNPVSSNISSNLSPDPDRICTYPLDQLLRLWKQEAIDVQQLAGFLLQNVILLEKRLRQVEAAARHTAVQPSITHTRVTHKTGK